MIYTCPAGPIRVVGARFSRTLTLVVRGRLYDETEGGLWEGRLIRQFNYNEK